MIQVLSLQDICFLLLPDPSGKLVYSLSRGFWDDKNAEFKRYLQR